MLSNFSPWRRRNSKTVKFDQPSSSSTRRKSSLLGSTFLSRNKQRGEEVDDPQIQVEIGSANKNEFSQCSIKSNFSMFGNKTECHYVGLFHGRTTSICANFLQENLHERIMDCLNDTSFVNSDYEIEEHFEDVLVKGFHQCSKDFDHQYPEDNSGSSAVALYILNNESVFVASVGNCKAVSFVDGKVEILSVEHTPSNEMERKRVLDNGGLIMQGEIMGCLSTSRGFGDNDLKSHLSSENVIISTPSISKLSLSGKVKLGMAKYPFIIIASSGVWSVFTPEAACKFVAKCLSQNGNNPTYTANKLLESVGRKRSGKTKETVSIISWGENLGSFRTRSCSTSSSRKSLSAAINEG